MAVNTSPSGRFLLAASQMPLRGGIFKCEQPMKLAPNLAGGPHWAVAPQNVTVGGITSSD